MSEPCRVCGLPLEVGELGCITRIRPHVSAPSAVIGDEIDLVVENLSHRPECFRSRERMKQRMRELGLIPFVRHVGEPGSDKSKATTRWT
jgi:hypothetical protein